MLSRDRLLLQRRLQQRLPLLRWHRLHLGGGRWALLRCFSRLHMLGRGHDPYRRVPQQRNLLQQLLRRLAVRRRQHRHLRERQCGRLLLTVHDEVGISLDNDSKHEAEEIARLYTTFDGVECPVKLRVPIRCDWGLGKDWYAAKG